MFELPAGVAASSSAAGRKGSTAMRRVYRAPCRRSPAPAEVGSRSAGTEFGWPVAEPAAPARRRVRGRTGRRAVRAGQPAGRRAVARALSYFGEHSLGWLALAGLGALLSPGGAAFVTGRHRDVRGPRGRRVDQAGRQTQRPPHHPPSPSTSAPRAALSFPIRAPPRPQPRRCCSAVRPACRHAAGGAGAPMALSRLVLGVFTDRRRHRGGRRRRRSPNSPRVLRPDRNHELSEGRRTSTPGRSAEDPARRDRQSLAPRQWVKNLLVLAPRGRARAVNSVTTTTGTCSSGRRSPSSCSRWPSSCVYLVNDARDVEADRAHPTKRFRPIAAGVLPVSAGLLASPSRSAWRLTGHLVVAHPHLALVMAVYIGVQLAYCFGLKHQAVLDICIVSLGFLLRAIAGGVTAGAFPLSQWFLLVMAFGSLFAAAGKRLRRTAARRTHRRQDPQSRWRLHQQLPAVRYGRCPPPPWCSATACSPSSATAGRPWFLRCRSCRSPSILRYAVDIDGGDAGEPEEIALHDRVLQVLALALIGTVCCRRRHLRPPPGWAPAPVYRYAADAR